MNIIRCDGTNIDEIYEIEEKSFSDPMKKETFLSDLERDSYYCYGLYDGSLTAFLSYEKVLDEAQVISVAVHPEHRRRGYAKKLFDEVVKRAKEDGIAFFSLEVRSENLPAISLYESMGFVRVGMRKNYYQNPVCDAVLMDMKIGKD